MWMSTARKRVQAGVEWLDHEVPEGWEPCINLTTLNLRAADRCVLGQVFADKADEWGTGYWYGSALLATTVQKRPDDFGFDATCSDIRKLQAAWVEVITTRRHEREFLTEVIANARPRV